jgi:hypothetical protein
MDDDAFRRLLDHLSLSWNGYRKVRKGVKKRLRNNLLTYYQDHITIPAFERIVGTLAPNGLLIVGAHEKVPPGIGRLVPDARFDRVWRAVT